MKRIKLDLGPRNYEILIGSGILSQFKSELKKLKLGKLMVVVTNPTVNKLYGRSIKTTLAGDSAFEVHFIEVPDSEESKSAAVCIDLIEKFAALDKGKGITVLAFGGGVIGDLAGFAASIYRRGVPYIQLPTTLLAQVDSSIGGKTAIDLPCGKNLIGSFYQPRMVFSEVRFLNSLDSKQVRAALAEIIKYAIISGSTFFHFLEKNMAEILRLKPKKLDYIIEVCSRIKARIVEEDETDRGGKRILLNFGHTTAHALESACGYVGDYPHGYAVALGMLVAAEIAKRLNMLADKELERITGLIVKAGLPAKITGLNLQTILEAQQHDKKFFGGKNRFVLPVCIGKTVVKEDVPQKIIIEAIKSKMAAESASLGDYE